MPFTIGTELTEAGIAVDELRISNAANATVNTLQTLYGDETFMSTFAGSWNTPTNNSVAVTIRNNSDASIDDGILIGGCARGLHNTATTYMTNDCVYVLRDAGAGDVPENRNWFRSRVDNNTDALTVAASWRTESITHSEGRFYHKANSPAQAAAGTAPTIFVADATQVGHIGAFNTTISTSGGIWIDRLGGGTTLPLITIDELVLYNTHETFNRIPYLRFGGSLTGAQNGSYIGNLILDGDISPYGLYLQNAPVDYLTPGSIVLRNGQLVGHAGSGTDTGYTLISNLSSSANRSRLRGRKFDIAAANGAGGSWDTLQECRLIDVRNSEEGINTGIQERQGLSTNSGGRQQASGQAIITSEFQFSILDDEGNPIEGATAIIPITDGTDVLDDGGANESNFNVNISSNNNAVPGDAHYLSIPDAAFITQEFSQDFQVQLASSGGTQTFTLDHEFTGTPTFSNVIGASVSASGTTVTVTYSAAINPQTLTVDYVFDRSLTSLATGNTAQQTAHLGYWQTDGLDAAAVNRRIANANNMFIRHGNDNTAFVSAFGFIPGYTQDVDFLGANVKTFETALIPDERVIGDSAPTNVTFDYSNGNVRLLNIATVNDIRDIIHAAHVEETVSGNGNSGPFNYEGITGDFIDGNGLAMHVSGAFQITAGENDRYQGITNTQLTFENGDNIILNGGTYNSTSTSRFEVGAMINGCEVTAVGDVRIANEIRNSTINGRTILAAGLDNDDIENVRFNGAIDEWPIPNATGHTFTDQIGLNINPPGVWTNNTFEGNAQINVQPDHVNNVTAVVTEDQQGQSDITIPDGSRVIDFTQWDNIGTLNLGGGSVWYALISPEQIGDFNAVDGTGANVAVLYPNNDINVVNDTEHPMTFIVKTGPAGTDIADMTVFHTGSVPAATNDNPTQTTTVPITRRELNAGVNVFRVFAASRLKIDYDSGEQGYQAAGGGRNYAPINDPLAQTGDVTTTLGNLSTAVVDTSSHRAWYVGLPTGSDYTSTAGNNADFFTLKAIDNTYVSYIADAGADKGMRGRLNGGILFYHEVGDGNPNTIDHTCGIRMTGTSVAHVPLGGAAYTRVNTDGTTDVIELNGNAADFNSNVVVGLPISVTIGGETTSETVGVTGVPDEAIDYPRISNALDNSQTAVVVDDIANGVGYTVSGGSKGLLGRTYDTGSDYTDEL